MEEERKKVCILDFDGVLAIPWTNPEEHYPQIPEIIRKIHASGDYVLMIASYNPKAFEAVKRWGLDSCFVAARCGANHAWHVTGEAYKEEHRDDMKKHRQIISMIDTELAALGVVPHSITFLDDDNENIKAVNAELPHVECILVDEKEGFGLHQLPI